MFKPRSTTEHCSTCNQLQPRENNNACASCGCTTIKHNSWTCLVGICVYQNSVWILPSAQYMANFLTAGQLSKLIFCAHLKREHYDKRSLCMNQITMNDPESSSFVMRLRCYCCRGFLSPPFSRTFLPCVVNIAALKRLNSN